MKNIKLLLLLPSILLVGCNQKELDKSEAKRRLNLIQHNYLPILKESYEIKFTQDKQNKNGKSLEKKEYHYYKEDHFGIHYIQKESGSATNYIDYYKITDATGDEIRFADYDYNNQKDKVAYVSKDIKEDDTCLPSDISNKYKNGVSLIEDYAYDYNDVTKTFTLYQEHVKYYGVGEDDIKIVVSYKEKDIPTTGEYNLKTEITAVYKDEKISSYKEVITTTSGEKSIKEFSVKYTKPDIKLPKNWKDFKKDYVVER